MTSDYILDARRVMIRPTFCAADGFIAFAGALFGFEATAVAVVFLATLATIGVDVAMPMVGEP